MRFQTHSESACVNDMPAKPFYTLTRTLPSLKPVLIMKLTVMIVLAACLQVSAKSYSQLITLKERKIPVEHVLQKIKYCDTRRQPL